MNDWLRSLALLAMAFAAVVVVTLGLAGIIVPTAGGGPAPEGSRGAEPSAAAVHQPGMVGGTLVVGGDRQGAFVLDREVTQDRYGLAGDDGRVLFDAGDDSVTVAQVQYDGLEFFVEPDACRVTAGARHEATGVAPAEIRCEAIDDVRDNGTIGLTGTVGVAADLFGLRGDLPETGGTIQLGDETLTIGAARLTIAPFGGAHAGSLLSDEGFAAAAVTLTYDPQTHGLTVAEVVHSGDVVPVSAGECSVSEREIGVLNPHTRVAELDIECAGIDMPSLGTVPLRVSVITEIAEPPQ